VKKLAAGCLVVLVLCAVAAGVGAFWLFRSARPLVERAGQTMDAIADLGRAKEIEATVTSNGTFSPPPDGELTEGQVARFLEVQRQVARRLGGGVDRLKAKYTELTAPGAQRVEYQRFLAALGDLSDVYLDGKRAQADALNAAHLSLDEFRWVRLRVYAAAGVEVTDVQLDALERLLKESGARAPDTTSTADLGAVPERNRALVKPHVQEIKGWVPLTLIGL
jgi:hypothetical protein